MVPSCTAFRILESFYFEFSFKDNFGYISSICKYAFKDEFILVTMINCQKLIKSFRNKIDSILGNSLFANFLLEMIQFWVITNYLNWQIFFL